MESKFAIYICPASLTEPGPVGFVVASDIYWAHRMAARVLKIGFEIRVVQW